MHAAVLRAQSPVLAVLVDDPMREATEGVVRWPYVDKCTFARFAQFAYTGRYDLYFDDVVGGHDEVARTSLDDMKAHCRLIILGDCYAVDRLTQHATYRLEGDLISLIHHVCHGLTQGGRGRGSDDRREGGETGFFHRVLLRSH